MRKLSGFLAAFTGCVAVALCPARASADEREVCVQAADQAQQLRDEGKYRKAREQMLVCSRDVCPSAVKRDCAQWLTELDASAPSIIVGAREGTQDITTVKLYVDGVLVAEKLDGKPVVVDPGEHTFRYEKVGGPSKEEKLVIRVGEKNRLVNVTFDKSSGGSSGGSSSGGSSSGGSSSGGSSSGGSSGGDGGGGGVPILTFVLGGVGVVGLAGFATFGILGKGDVDDMKKPLAEGGCAPSCSDDRVDSAKRKLLIADISLGVGVAGIAGAVVVYLLRPKAEVKTTGLKRFDFSPLPGGGAATVGGSF